MTLDVCVHAGQIFLQPLLLLRRKARKQRLQAAALDVRQYRDHRQGIGRKAQQPLAAVVRRRGDRQHAACAQPLHRRRYIGFCQTAVAADVPGGVTFRVVVQKQQDVDLQLVEPVCRRGGLKLRGIVFFVVLYIG